MYEYKLYTEKRLKMYYNYIIDLINVNTHTKLSVHHKKNHYSSISIV